MIPSNARWRSVALAHRPAKESESSFRIISGSACAPWSRRRESNAGCGRVETRRKQPVQGHVREHVETGSELFTDALKSYDGLDGEFLHQVIDHAEAYVDGQVHTNRCENFWFLLNRSLKGNYVSVETYHLF